MPLYLSPFSVLRLIFATLIGQSDIPLTFASRYLLLVCRTLLVVITPLRRLYYYKTIVFPDTHITSIIS